MAYAALQDLIDRYSADEMTGLTDRTGAGQPDETVVARALDDAGQLIDSYLASRYQLPLDPVPQVVVRWACDIARMYLYKDQVTDAVKALYNAAVASLAAARDGRLVLEAGAIDAPTTGGGAAVSGPGRVFDHDSLRRF